MIGMRNWFPPRMLWSPVVSSALATPAPAAEKAAATSATRAARTVHLCMSPPRVLIVFTGGSGGSRPDDCGDALSASPPRRTTGDVDHRSEFWWWILRDATGTGQIMAIAGAKSARPR